MKAEKTREEMIKLVIRKSFKFCKSKEDSGDRDLERQPAVNFEEALSYSKINKKFIKDLFDKPNFQRSY